MQVAYIASASRGQLSRRPSRGGGGAGRQNGAEVRSEAAPNSTGTHWSSNSREFRCHRGHLSVMEPKSRPDASRTGLGPAGARVQDSARLRSNPTAGNRK